LQSVNTITLPNGYIQALKQFEDYQEQDNDWNKETSRQLSKKIYSFSQEAKQLNQYKHNNSEKDVMVDINNMTPEQQKELTLFAADLINQIRQQAGTPLVTVTPGSIELGKKIIKEGYNDPSWDVFGPHMIDGKSHNSNYIYSLSESVAENVDGALTSWRAENGQWVKNEHNSIQSMDALKQSIYSDFLSMMFADASSNWGHTLNFVNYGTLNSISNSTLGFGYDKYGYSHYDFAGATPENHLGDTPYTIPSNSELITEYNNAKNDQATKQSAYDNAKSTNDAAQQALSDAQSDKQVEDNNVASAQANLTKAESTLSDTSNGLTNAQNALVQAQAVQASAQQAVDNLSADLKTKQAAVNKASQELNAAKTALS